MVCSVILWLLLNIWNISNLRRDFQLEERRRARGNQVMIADEKKKWAASEQKPKSRAANYHFFHLKQAVVQENWKIFRINCKSVHKLIEELSKKTQRKLQIKDSMAFAIFRQSKIKLRKYSHLQTNASRINNKFLFAQMNITLLVLSY